MRMTSELLMTHSGSESRRRSRSNDRSLKNLKEEESEKERSHDMKTTEFRSADSSLLEIRACPSEDIVAHTNDDSDAILCSSILDSQYTEAVEARQQGLTSEPGNLEGELDKVPFKEISAGHSLNTGRRISKSTRYVKPFEKPARKPMRQDSDNKRKKATDSLATREKRKEITEKPDARIHNPDSKKSHRKKVTKTKQIATLVSALSNITEGISPSRLTLPHRPPAGIFNHGRQAGNRHSSGVPDLTFTRIDKLAMQFRSSKTGAQEKSEKSAPNVDEMQSESLHIYSGNRNSLESAECASTINTDKFSKERPPESRSVGDVVESYDAELQEFPSQPVKQRQMSQDQDPIISPRPIHAHERNTLATLEENAKEQTSPVRHSKEYNPSQLEPLPASHPARSESPHTVLHPKQLLGMIQEYTSHYSASKRTTQEARSSGLESHPHSTGLHQPTYKSAHINQYSYYQADKADHPSGRHTPHEYDYQVLMPPVSAKYKHYGNNANRHWDRCPVDENYCLTTTNGFDTSIPAIQIHDNRDYISADFGDFRRSPESRDYIFDDNKADQTCINDESSAAPGSTSAYYGHHVHKEQCGSVCFDQYINDEAQYNFTDTCTSTFDQSVANIQPVVTTAESEGDISRLSPSSYCYLAESDNIDIYHTEGPCPPKFKRHRLY
ncbi:hypothetical protein V1509DRAFT_631479 [Lipomyces kononenkoae]